MQSCNQKLLKSKIDVICSTFLVARFLTEYRSGAKIPTAKLVGTEYCMPFKGERRKEKGKRRKAKVRGGCAVFSV